MEEVWKPVVGWEELYEVSNLGRTRRSKDGVNTKAGRLHNHYVTIKGYAVAELCDSSRTKTCKVHRLVAMAFIPNPLGLLEINHINGIKTDNRVDNLEWCTRSHNAAHASRVLGHFIGERNPNSKLTEKDVLFIRSSQHSCVKLSKQFGVDKSIICDIWNRKTWKHVADTQTPELAKGY